MTLSRAGLIKILKSGHTWFDRIERYRMGDKVISFEVDAHPSNTNLRQIFEKVVLINSIYGTNIYSPFQMAKHICRQHIDSRLRHGDIRLVRKLRSGHRIMINHGNEEYDFYSFATKYLSWHFPESFPIFDNLVKRLLPKLNKRFKFHEPRFTQKDLGNYATLKCVIDSLSTFTGLQRFKYK